MIFKTRRSTTEAYSIVYAWKSPIRPRLVIIILRSIFEMLLDTVFGNYLVEKIRAKERFGVYNV
jgi:hypothetical protein